MKKKILLILLSILIVVTILLVSCNHQTCPTYGGRTTSGAYTHLKSGTK